MDLAIASILILLITFFLGSIPFGVIISRLFFKKDIRNEGSGNIGTTNAMRSLGKIGGGAVFILDFGKGLFSGFLGTVFAGMTAPLSGYEAGQLVLALSFFGCVVGHIYSPWLKFHGGKGIAVAIGALFFVFGPLFAVFELVIFAVLVVGDALCFGGARSLRRLPARSSRSIFTGLIFPRRALSRSPLCSLSSRIARTSSVLSTITRIVSARRRRRES